MEALKLIPYIVLTLCVAGIIAGAVAIVNDKFADSLDNRCYNSSYTFTASINACNNNTEINGSIGKGDLNFSDAYYTIYQANQGNMAIAEQFTTIGIISVLVIIISLLAGVFTYMRYFS